jgi:hypothetical protein
MGGDQGGKPVVAAVNVSPQMLLFLERLLR